MEDAAIEKVASESKIDIPNGMIELEIDNMEDNISQRLQYQGLTFEKYLKMVGKTEADVREEFKDDAKKNIITRLVLEQIVEDEKIKPDAEDVKKHFEEMAKQYNRKVEELEKNEELKEYLEKSSQNELAVKLIIDNAKLTK